MVVALGLDKVGKGAGVGETLWLVPVTWVLARDTVLERNGVDHFIVKGL